MMAAQDAACPVWVHFDGQQYCSPTLERAQQPVESAGTEAILPFDRVLGGKGLSGDQVPSILYADITSPLFADFHQTVSRTAREGQTTYRVRYRPALGEISPQPLFLNGYGVELALKRTDYIVIDDREASKTRSGDQETHDTLVDDEAPEDIKPLSKSEVSNLGVNAASFVMESEDSLDTLIKVVQDFPKHSALIASHNATDKFMTEYKANREAFLPPGYNIMWLNGLQVDPRNLNAFSILDQLRKERALISTFREEGFTAEQAVAVLSHPDIAQAQVNKEAQRYDYRDDSEGGKVIIWLNDIEKDKRYQDWPSELQAFLQRTYPGQLPSVRRELHNLVIPLDLADLQEVELVVATLQNFIKRTVPVRFGIVPTLRTPTSRSQAKVAYHIVQTYGLSALFQYFEKFYDSGKEGAPSKSTFTSAIKGKSIKRDQISLPFEEVLDSDDLESRLLKTREYLERLALQGEFPPLFANGVAIARTDDWLEVMSNTVSMDLRQIQRGIYEQKFVADMWLPDFYLYQAAKRRNALVIPEDQTTIKNIPLGQVFSEHRDLIAGLPRVKASPEITGSKLLYLLVVADLDSKTGRSLLLDAVSFRKAHPEAEVAVLHNAAPDTPCSTFSLKAQFLLHEENTDDLDTLLSNLQNLNEEASEEITKACSTPSTTLPFLEVLNLPAGTNGLLLNQRLIAPINEGDFLPGDFEMLFKFEEKKHFEPLTTALKGLNFDGKVDSPLSSAKLNSLVALAFVSDVPEGIYESVPLIRIDKFKVWEGEHSSIHIGTTDNPTLQIVAAVDPTVETAQQWLPLLKVLSELDGIDVKIYLNPRENIQELDIKRFYRQVLDSGPRFDADGLLQRPQATFKGIPEAALLNLGMLVPPTWLVAPKHCTYDLDNIKLNTLAKGSNIEAIYELEHILIEGHSRDAAGQPPRGVQLLLGTKSKPHYTDTIIMANLGYFQFKANPGVWQLSLQPGRSSKIFTIDSLGTHGYQAQADDKGASVSLLSFEGVTLYPKLSRNKGYETADVLETGPKPGSAMDYLNRASSAFSSSFTKSASSVEHADINIFSVASGHLYERMLNIMILSVLKNTKSTVKFWFIEQFLSPSFKELLPGLASHYNFSYEMVTYKWPHWLRAQKEKQREIWGYKILFLDVLFPISLDKVIFVDADQIVRTDMLELTKVDLHGAPYGFTPMCDSRTDMEGFRFWKQGYWHQYLQGKPYHISALYVVDLKKFRELAAGDRLRQQYHTLSADPASLSNLDQDLPNHMQHHLPIHSLDQDWLWCETWCSDEAFQIAKTVDLCNNPLTKEPKLERARRQVPEWTVYDEEIADVARNIKIHESESANHVGKPEDEGGVLRDSIQEKLDEGRQDGGKLRDEL